MNEDFSERLRGIENALVLRVSTILVEHSQGRVRLTPSALDEVRHWAGIAIRGAALEGARSVDQTYAALIPSPKTGRAYVQEFAATQQRDTPEMTITTHYVREKLPSGV